MVKTLESNSSIEKIKLIFAELYSAKSKKLFNAKKYCGKIKIKEDPLDIQKRLRDEWD